MGRRIDITRLQPGQRVFARVSDDRAGGWAFTGYAMRVNVGGPGLALADGTIVDILSPAIVVETASTDDHHAPWTPDPLPELLPTEAGSLILAKVRHHGLRLLQLLPSQTGHPASGGRTWDIVGAGDWVDVADIGEDWVQIDPETLLPVEQPGAKYPRSSND